VLSKQRNCHVIRAVRLLLLFSAIATSAEGSLDKGRKAKSERLLNGDTHID
jgi:hypothetical protein